MKKKSLTNAKGEVRELLAADFRAMKPAREVLPAELLAVLPKRKRGERGQAKQPTKILTSVRFSPEVIDFFKASGDGWQTRIDETLRQHISTSQKRQRKAA
jgi:uncharacterized protein (DUF4415 family)